MDIKKREFDNPFPREAVAVFGKKTLATAKFNYMRKSADIVNTYLQEHPISEKRFGGGYGFAGGHGSGKTHLLIWLADLVHDIPKADTTVAYAKADSPSLFALYTRFVDQISRDRFIKLNEHALRTVGKAEVSRARATESIKDRISKPGDIQKLEKEGTIDSASLVRRLQQNLKGWQVPVDIVKVIVDIDASTWGLKAYNWMVGNQVAEYERIGIRQSLRQLSENMSGDWSTDEIAIYALEAIAALHKLAERPFILLIDQFETLLGDINNHARAYSLLKKLVEQIGGQKGLVLIAGNKEAWETPRDVAPRLRTRTPIAVGHLNEQETALLLKAYQPKAPAMKQNEIQTLNRLSGGNAREILLIAHCAFEIFPGKFDQLESKDLIAFAEKSGSIAERKTLALEMLDDVLKEFGEISHTAELGDGYAIDRVWILNRKPQAAFTIVDATDRLREVDSARHVSELMKRLQDRWPHTILVIIAVGYTSHEIRSLFELTSYVVIFRELEFKEEVRSKLIDLSSQRSGIGDDAAEQSQDVYRLLEKMSVHLDAIQEQRLADDERIQERIVEGTQVMAEPELKQRQSKTRWELLEQLDELQDLLIGGDLMRERELMRSMLISNEAHLKLGDFDFLGGLYLDLLSKALREESWKLYFDKRAMIIDELRKKTREKTFLDKCVEKPFIAALIGGGVCFVIWVIVRSFFLFGYMI